MRQIICWCQYLKLHWLQWSFIHTTTFCLLKLLPFPDKFNKKINGKRYRNERKCAKYQLNTSQDIQNFDSHSTDFSIKTVKKLTENVNGINKVSKIHQQENVDFQLPFWLSKTNNQIQYSKAEKSFPSCLTIRPPKKKNLNFEIFAQINTSF